MPTFQDRIKSTLARVTPGAGANQGPTAPFDEVLNEFVDTLMAERPYVGAAIETGHLPAMRALVTWPRLLRDERSIMLTFWWEGTAMRVLDENNQQPLTTPDALRDYLINFLANSAFPTTLMEYERRCKEDVDGFLRARSFTDASPEDVSVVVRAADQEKIANAAPGTHLNLELVPERLPSTAEYSGSVPYPYLISGGFGMKTVKHGMAGGKIHFSGVVMGPDKTE